MGLLRPIGITGWSWLNCLGSGSWTFSNGARGPSLEEALRESRFENHEAQLHIPGWSGRAPEPPFLPRELAPQESRCTRLLAEGLGPLLEEIGTAVARVGSRRVGLVLGSSTGGIDATEAALRHERRTGNLPSDYDFVEIHPYHALLTVVRHLSGARGPGLVVSTACSSTGKALASAQRMIESGAADVVIAGGADALCEMTVRGFSGLEVLGDQPCRPFDAKRAGINIGEGAAFVLLDGDAKTPWSFLGAGESSDAHHPTSPHPEGLGARLSIQACLRACGLVPSDVSYLNAHGTGTKKNDEMEARAIFDALGGAVPFSSTKFRTGHQLGAAGGTEAALCLQALCEGAAPTGFVPEFPDESLACQPMKERVLLPSDAVVLSTSFAFGGSNVAVALGNSKKTVSRVVPEDKPIWIKNVAIWAPGIPDMDAFARGVLPTPKGDDKPAAELLNVRVRGRASLLTRVFAELYGQLCQSGDVDASSIPTVYSSMYGEMTTTMVLLDQLESEPRLSPIRFQASVHNTASGQISLATKNRAFSTALAAGADSFAMALMEARGWLAVHGGSVFVLVADETLPPRLFNRPAFPSLGVGLHLCAEPGNQAWGAISDLHLTDSGAAATPPPLSPESPRARPARLLSSSPVAWGLPLLDALLGRRSGPIEISPSGRLLLSFDR